MSTNTERVSLSLRPGLIKEIDEAAVKRGHGIRSRLATDLFVDFKDLSEESQQTLRDSANQRGVTVAELVEFLVDRFSLEDLTVKPVVLKIPVDVITNKEALSEWLSRKCQVLINHLHPE